MKKKTILLFLTIICFVILFTGWKVFGPLVTQPADKYFYIESGSTIEDVKNDLVEKKIIGNGPWYGWVSSVLKFENVKAGRYEIQQNMSIFQLVRMIKNGQQASVRFIITKLRLKEDLARKMGQQFEFDSASAMEFLSNNDSLKTFGLDTNTVMAAVMPDTYSFFWNSNPKKVFQRLFDHWQKFWNDERNKKAELIGMTPMEVTILASIVDEESNKPEEKKKIASVYINRLQKKMSMQACPTIKFALKDFGLKRIYEKHLKVQSPYNTYNKPGLPPGPICTPQPETIDIVLNAPQTDYLYFVANSDFSGTHVYTTNYSDHLKWAKKFQDAQDRQDSIRKANKP